METKTRYTAYLAMVIAGLLVILGVSFSWFSTRVEGEGTQLEAETALLSLNYDGGEAITLEKAYSGDFATKTFSVTNTGTVDAEYNLYFEIDTNTFVHGDLVYTLEGTNGGVTVEETVIPPEITTGKYVISRKIDIPQGETQEYTLKVEFKERDRGQNKNQGVTFIGKVQVEVPDEESTYFNPVYYASLNDVASDLTFANPNSDKNDGTVVVKTNESGHTYIKLLQDQTLSSAIALTSGKTTVDLNGKTLTINAAGVNLVINNGTLVIRDSVGTGKIVKSVDSTSAQNIVNVLENGHLIVEEGTFEITNNSGTAIALRSTNVTSGSVIEVHNPTIIVNATTGNAKGIQCAETNILENPIITTTTTTGRSSAISGAATSYIYGGSLSANSTSGLAFALDYNSGTTAYIYNGNFNGKNTSDDASRGGCGALFNANSTTHIYNGRFEGQSSKSLGDNASIGISANDTIFIYDGNYKGITSGAALTVSKGAIYGGYFDSINHGGVYVVTDGEFAIFGGTFNNSASTNGSSYFSGNGSVYIDNATFTGARLAVTNTYGTDMTVYMSNTTLPMLRVDNPHKAVIGKNVGEYEIYTQSTGVIDTTNYANIQFTEEYVDKILNN